MDYLDEQTATHLAQQALNPYLRGQILTLSRYSTKDDEWPPNTHMS
ncbi:hypothetical protein [Alteraurantiacibacter aquimixticola]|nr:hypothetical protein [Alteraurantiacibacter aquimixticola]